MARMRQWAIHEPWMALTAFVATVSAATLASIRWLGLFGVVRVFMVTHISGSLDTYTTSTVHRQIGLAAGPSPALTHLDRVMWGVGIAAGALWMLRLGLRSADRRIGIMRGIGLVGGFAVFVVTGVMHCVAEAVTTKDPDRTHRWITAWCGTAIVTALFVMFYGDNSPAFPARLGDHAVRAPAGWSILHNLLQLAVVVGGWLLAALLTRRWTESAQAPASFKRPAASRT